jgi:hypothetical protein
MGPGNPSRPRNGREGGSTESPRPFRERERGRTPRPRHQSPSSHTVPPRSLGRTGGSQGEVSERRRDVGVRRDVKDCHDLLRMMRSWRSPRLLRIALRCSAPTPERKEPGETPPMPPSASALSFDDAQDMTFDWLRTCPAGALDGSGNLQVHPSGWPDRPCRTSQRSSGPSLAAGTPGSQNVLFHVRQRGFR